MEEFVLKTFAYAEGRGDFDGKVTKFLNNYARDNQGADKVAKISAEFASVLKNIGKVQSSPILKENYSVTPLNLAEAVFVAALELSRSKIKLTPKPGWLKDKLLLKYSTSGTNTKKSLLGRIDRAKELLSGAKPEPK